VNKEEIEKFYQEMIDEIDLQKLIYDSFIDYLTYFGDKYYGFIPATPIIDIENIPKDIQDKAKKSIEKWNKYYFRLGETNE
jgi:hypothetical protein